MSGESNNPATPGTATPAPVAGSAPITEQAAVDLLKKRGDGTPAPSAAPTVGAQPVPPATDTPPAEPKAEKALSVDELLDDTTEDKSEDTVDKPSDDSADDASIVFKLDDGTEVSRAEARLGYLRQADYTTKTTQVADLRKAVDERVQVNHKAVEFFNNVVPKILDHMEKVLIPPKPDEALRSTDPMKYWDQYNAHRVGAEQYQSLMQAKQVADLAATDMNQAHFAEWMQEQSIKLLEVLPQWSNPKIKARDQVAIVNYAKSRGFTDDEIARADHRLIAAMLDAVIGKKVREGGYKAVRPGNASPTIARGDAAGGVDRKDQAAQAREKARQSAVSVSERPRDRMAAGVQLLTQRRAAMNGTGRV